MASDLQLLRCKYKDIKLKPMDKGTLPLIVMSGLPGTGKSYLSHRIATEIGYIVISSDAVRKALVRRPKYTSNEHYRVFRACHSYIKEVIDNKFGVIFDATNLNTHAINPLRKIAEANNIECIIIRCEADESVIKTRLSLRSHGQNDYESDADWSVYMMLKPNQKHIPNCDYIVDSSAEIEWIINELSERIGG